MKEVKEKSNQFRDIEIENSKKPRDNGWMKIIDELSPYLDL